MASTPDIYLATERPEHFRNIGWDKFIDKFEAFAAVMEHDDVQFDLETSGLNSARVERVNSFQLGIPGKQFVFDAHTIPLKEAKEILETKRLFGHNLGFDIAYCYVDGIVPRRVIDTMVVETELTKGIFTPRGYRGLEQTLYRRLGVVIDKSAQKTIAGGLQTVADIMYAGRDVMPLFDLYEAQMTAVRALRLEDRVHFENVYLPAHCYLEFSGIKVDKEKLERWVREIEADEMLLLRKMETTYGEINWASQDQVGGLLERDFNIVHKSEDTGKYQTGDEVLSKYDVPIAKDILEYRGMAKLVSTYGRKWFHYILPDGRIHTRYRQNVETGRTACGDTQDTGNKYDPCDVSYRCGKPFPNMQNLPRRRKDWKLNFRDIFVPKKGNAFICADFSGQESVLLADQSEDPTMLQLLGEDGRDPHSYVVRLAWPELAELSDEEIKKQHGDKRDLAKTCYSLDTEVLTPTGWRFIGDIKLGDIVMQVKPGENRQTLLSWTPTIGIVRKANEFDHLISIKNQNIDCLVTPDHTMLTYSGTMGAGKMIIDTAENIYGSRSRLMLSGGQFSGGTESVGSTMASLVVAAQADGSIGYGGKIRFGFSKKRKYERLLKLLTADEYKDYTKGGVFRLELTSKKSEEIKIYLDGKMFSWRMLNWSEADRETVLNEIKYWDGNSCYDGPAKLYNSADVQNVDILQALASISNRKANRCVPTVSELPQRRDVERLTVRRHPHVRLDDSHFSRIPYVGEVVCVTVPDGFILTRRKGKTLIAGNCAFAIAYGGNGKTVSDNIGCTPELGDYIYTTYMEAFPTLKEFFRHCYDFAWRRGYMPTDWVTGGKRFFDRATEYREIKERSTGKDKKYWNRYWEERDENTEWYQKEAEKMGWYNMLTSSLRKESVNTRIQGTGAVMTKLALIYFFDWIMQNKMFGKVLVVLSVHDELVAECNRRSAERVAEALQDCMTRAGSKCLKHLSIKADAIISEVGWVKD